MYQNEMLNVFFCKLKSNFDECSLSLLNPHDKDDALSFEFFKG